GRHVPFAGHRAAGDAQDGVTANDVAGSEQCFANLARHGGRGQRLKPLPMRVETLELRGHVHGTPSLYPPDHAPPTSSCSVARRTSPPSPQAPAPSAAASAPE